MIRNSRMHIVLGITLLAVMLSACEKELTRFVKGKFDNGQPKMILYYDGERAEENFVKMETYYENGQIKSIINFDGADKDGIMRSWHPNGQPLSKAEYVKDKKEGYTFYNHKNGQTKYEGNYLHNRKDGKWVAYNKEGDTLRVETYEKGKLIDLKNYRRNTK